MTRPHIEKIDCPYCNKRITAETAFGRWLRKNKLIDSRLGWSIHDQDYWIHRYKVFGGREFQLLMGLEIKTRCGKVTECQRDTMHIVNQLIRNRRQTPTKDLRWQAGNTLLKVFSVWLHRRVNLRCYGVHIVQFSGLGPDDSEQIKWDGKVIDINTLTALIRFDLDPDTLRPIDLRNHHLPKIETNITLFEDTDAK